MDRREEVGRCAGIMVCSGVFPASCWRIQFCSFQEQHSSGPYFHVEADDGAERLPLKSTTVSIDIKGVIADVRLQQRYRNYGIVPINAVYVLPGSTRAAVNAMHMQIGDRSIVAKIDEIRKAKKKFDQAKRASLFLFSMLISNTGFWVPWYFFHFSGFWHFCHDRSGRDCMVW